MNYQKFLDRIIADETENAKVLTHKRMQEGFFSGLESCRGLGPVKLWDLVAECRRTSRKAYAKDPKDHENHCYFRGRRMAVEIICRTASSILWLDDMPVIRYQHGFGMDLGAKVLGIGVAAEA